MSFTKVDNEIVYGVDDRKNAGQSVAEHIFLSEPQTNMQHVESVQEMAYDRLQHVSVAKRIAKTGNIGTSRHVAGFLTVSDKVFFSSRR